MSPNKGGYFPRTRNLPYTSRKRKNITAALTTSSQNKNTYSPLQNIDYETERSNTFTTNTPQNVQVKLKIPSIYVYKIYDSLSNKIIDGFSIKHTKNSLNLNLIVDYKTITKCFDESKIEYYTYQLITIHQSNNV